MFPDRFLNLSFSKAHRQLTYLSHPTYNSLRKMNAQANANVNNNQAHQQGGQGQQQPAPQAGQYGFIGPLPQGQLPPYLPPNAAVPLQGPPPVPGAIPPILQQVADTLEGVTQHLLLLQPPPADPNEADYCKTKNYINNRREQFVKMHVFEENEPDSDHLKVLLTFLTMFFATADCKGIPHLFRPLIEDPANHQRILHQLQHNDELAAADRELGKKFCTCYCDFDELLIDDINNPFQVFQRNGIHAMICSLFNQHVDRSTGAVLLRKQELEEEEVPKSNDQGKDIKAYIKRLTHLCKVAKIGGARITPLELTRIACNALLRQ